MQRRKTKTREASGRNSLTTSAKAIGTTLGQLAIKASEVMAAGQQEALLPGVPAKDSMKKTTTPKKIIAQKTATNRGQKAAATTGIRKSLATSTRGKK